MLSCVNFNSFQLELLIESKHGISKWDLFRMNATRYYEVGVGGIVKTQLKFACDCIPGASFVS